MIFFNKKLQCLEKRNKRNEINFNRIKYELILGTDNKRGAIISQKQKQMRKYFVYYPNSINLSCRSDVFV